MFQEYTTIFRTAFDAFSWIFGSCFGLQSGRSPPLQGLKCSFRDTLSLSVEVAELNEII